MNMPNISVVVPVYKVENTLHYCVDSILSQTYNDFELILVDDGSPDNSGKICDDYAQKDSRVAVIHKENGGVSSARNVGINNSRGKYICFVDSDDYIDKNFLEILVDIKSKYNGADNFWCYFRTVDDYSFKRSEEINEALPNVETYGAADIMTLHNLWLDAGPYCKLYDREVINKNKIKFDENLSFGEDLIFNYQYLDNTNKSIIVINDKLYNYVQGDLSSLSKKYYPDLLSIYNRIYNEIKYYMKKWNCDEEQLKIFYNCYFYSYETILRNTFHKDNNSETNKIKLNNSIMKSAEFKSILKKTNCFIHPLYRLAYKIGNYRLVLLVDKLVNLKYGHK